MEEITRSCFAELQMKIAVAGTPKTDELLLHANTSGKIDVHATRSHASACARKSKRFSLNLLTDCEQNGKTVMHDSLCLPIIMFAGSSSPGTTRHATGHTKGCGPNQSSVCHTELWRRPELAALTPLDHR
jgi:hypothetical protein